MENLIRNATTTDPWGPTSKQCEEIRNHLLEILSTAQLTGSDERYGGYYDDEGYGVEYGNPASDAISFIITRIVEYSNRFSREGFVGKLKKNYITNGNEHRIVSKCLSLLEYLVINCYQPPLDILPHVAKHIDYLKELHNDYQCTTSKDGHPDKHTDIVREKAGRVVQLIKDKKLLAKHRQLLHKANQKIVNSSSRGNTSFEYDTEIVCDDPNNSATDDDEFGEYEEPPVTPIINQQETPITPATATFVDAKPVENSFQDLIDLFPSEQTPRTTLQSTPTFIQPQVQAKSQADTQQPKKDVFESLLKRQTKK
ncbi:BA75_01587T0 [Komagataella pastoris]|uniref:BA75_01587T0 n=1 Tax=Komagataella pastoris TaxID=4922 RepID=A0A1B2J9I6_PICPA|nr:BA75_01587T0 [Komagataella pastoris]